MKRREFMAASCLAGLAPLAAGKLAEADESCERPEKEFYELRLYSLASAAKRDRLCEFLGKAAIPALNRQGISPVGVFQSVEQENADLYVLLPSKCPVALLGATGRLMADEKYLADGADLLGTPKSDPAYERIESSILLAFDETPKVAIPSKKETRVFQLRIYESHNAERAKKKIDMFNKGGEIALFRETGLNPVFFGEALVGSKIPNLTYMLGFDDMATGEAAWKKFIAHPKWTALSGDPQYKDTVSNITNLFLRPAACSQI